MTGTVLPVQYLHIPEESMSFGKGITPRVIRFEYAFPQS
jgi:hypothetical protein